jgi:hypothetical protein
LSLLSAFAVSSRRCSGDVASRNEARPEAVDLVISDEREGLRSTIDEGPRRDPMAGGRFMNGEAFLTEGPPWQMCARPPGINPGSPALRLGGLTPKGRDGAERPHSAVRHPRARTDVSSFRCLLPVVGLGLVVPELLVHRIATPSSQRTPQGGSRQFRLMTRSRGRRVEDLAQTAEQGTPRLLPERRHGRRRQSATALRFPSACAKAARSDVA